MVRYQKFAADEINFETAIFQAAVAADCAAYYADQTKDSHALVAAALAWADIASRFVMAESNEENSDGESGSHHDTTSVKLGFGEN